jgi:hypothetical protein
MSLEKKIEKYDVEETKKAIVAIKEGFVGLRNVDWDKVAKECSEIDSDEWKEIMSEIAKLAFRFMSYAQQGKQVLRFIRLFIK